jgi:hypothetical protein
VKSTIIFIDDSRIEDVELAPNAHGITFRDEDQDRPGDGKKVQVLVPWHRIHAIITTEEEIEAEAERNRQAFLDSAEPITPDNVREMPAQGVEVERE